jgi:hypothetical protein
VHVGKDPVVSAWSNTHLRKEKWENMIILREKECTTQNEEYVVSTLRS